MLPTRAPRDASPSPPPPPPALSEVKPDRNFYAEKQRSTTMLIVNVCIFFVLALLFFAVVWGIFHLLDNYNRFYNNNSKLYKDAVELIRLGCQPYAMNSVAVFAKTAASTTNTQAVDAEDVLHPELHAAKQKMDSLYDIRNQQLLEAEKSLNDICRTAREHANMNVWVKSQQQAVAELLHHMWPINWFGCTPNDQLNSCHYAIFTSLSYLTHSASGQAPVTTPTAKIDVFQTPIQMINDLVRMLALAVMAGTVLTVLVLMFCQRSAAYTIQIGTVSILVLIVGSSLIWNAVLTLWSMIKLVAGCVLFVLFLMGPALSLLKCISSTKIAQRIEDAFDRAQQDKARKTGISVNQTVQEHAHTDPTGLFATVAAQLEDSFAPFPNKMSEWIPHYSGTRGDRPYYTMPALSTSTKAKAA